MRSSSKIPLPVPFYLRIGRRLSVASSVGSVLAPVDDDDVQIKGLQKLVLHVADPGPRSGRLHVPVNDHLGRSAIAVVPGAFHRLGVVPEEHFCFGGILTGVQVERGLHLEGVLGEVVQEAIGVEEANSRVVNRLVNAGALGEHYTNHENYE